MPNIFKKNKRNIITQHRKKIILEYFGGGNYLNIAEKYGYNQTIIKKFLDGPATKTFIDSNNVTWRRCSICYPTTYKTLDNYLLNHYGKNGKKYLMSCCSNCYNRKQKNKRIIARNIGDRRIGNTFKKSWEKNKIKYNFRRRFLRIIGYLDSKGKIQKKS